MTTKTPWMYYVTMGIIQGTLMFCFLITFYFVSVVPQYNRSFDQNVDKMVREFRVLTESELLHTSSPTEKKVIQAIDTRDESLEEQVRQVESINHRIFQRVVKAGLVLFGVATLLLLLIYWIHPHVSIKMALLSSMLSMVFVATIEYFFLYSVNNRYRMFSHYEVSKKLTNLLATK